jgi:glycosyltransferase involved in cell wall biosynthesis
MFNSCIENCRGEGVGVLILERDFGGHRLSYVRQIVLALSDVKERSTKAEIRLWVGLTKETLTTSEYSVHLQDLEAYFKVFELPPSLNRKRPFSVAFAKLLDWRQVEKSELFDHVYIPYADGLYQLLAVYQFFCWKRKKTKKITLELIIMRSTFLRRSNFLPDAIKIYFTRLALLNNPATLIHLIDIRAWIWSSQYKNTRKKIRLLPDPVANDLSRPSELSRKELSLPVNGRLVGCIGLIDERKGADLLIEAFCLAKIKPSDYLVLAGRHSESILKLLALKQNTQIISIDHYLSEKDLSLYFSALDLVIAPYRNSSGPASLVLNAAAAGRPVLASNHGWLGIIVRVFKLGSVCQVDDLAEFSTAIQDELLSLCDFSQSERSKELAVFSSIENFSLSITYQLQHRLGLKRLPIEKLPKECIKEISESLWL